MNKNELLSELVTHFFIKEDGNDNIKGISDRNRYKYLQENN